MASKQGQLQQLKRAHGLARAHVTKKINRIRGLMDNPDNLSTIKDLLNKLSNVLYEFQRAHNAYHSQICDENELHDSEQYGKAVELSVKELDEYSLTISLTQIFIFKMGISGLLQFPPVKQVTVEELLSNFSGKTAAVDVSGWIHKALSITAFGDYDSYTKHVWRYVRLLERNGVTPIQVFDGQNFEAKLEETDKRESEYSLTISLTQIFIFKMGISGLLQFPPVKQVTVEELLSNVSGKTAAVDVSGWIHKALSITAFGDYDSYTKHVWRYVRLLERNGVTPIQVFDGQNFEAKLEETDKRER
ncbi:exonuclease 1 [Paramuricea clavata]|uniref:Exonuclease 1 n=1 Tax=Paramuricea clavata TaxID=317549 RepID=A0A7D9E2Z9_PARCT|nr:exonuclease 1 [Paramuricea clavata]